MNSRGSRCWLARRRGDFRVRGTRHVPYGPPGGSLFGVRLLKSTQV